jgi:hypothetical protein
MSQGATLSKMLLHERRRRDLAATLLLDLEATSMLSVKLICFNDLPIPKPVDRVPLCAQALANNSNIRWFSSLSRPISSRQASVSGFTLAAGMLLCRSG